MGLTIGTRDINGFGFPVTAIAAGGFKDTTSAAAVGIAHTLGPVIGTIVTIAVTTVVTTIAITIAAGIVDAIATMIGAGVATRGAQASKRWRSGPAEGVIGLRRRISAGAGRISSARGLASIRMLLLQRNHLEPAAKG